MGNYLLNQTQQQYYNDSAHYGSYQFTSLEDVINNFMATYVGEDKVLPKTHRSDIVFHAHRAMQELSFDTFKTVKSQEITVPASLQMILPQDYVNYTKISWVDSAGVKHRLYPTLCNTSNPTNPFQNDDEDIKLTADATFTVGSRYLVLDKEYSNIQVGMRVISPHTPAPLNIISNIATDGTVTTIELADGVFVGANLFSSLVAATSTVEIQNTDGSILHSPTTYAVNAATSTADSYILTVSATDISNIEVGMIIACQTVEYIAAGTTVVAINGNDITMSNKMGPLYATGTTLDINFISPISNSDTWNNYNSATPSENQDDYIDDTYWPNIGERYGLEPSNAQANGSYYIDNSRGLIHFSSNISGKTVVLDYISDSLADCDCDQERNYISEPCDDKGGATGTSHGQGDPGRYGGGGGGGRSVLAKNPSCYIPVHKFAEEAVYKWILYGAVSARIDIPEHIVLRYKKERFAETRKAKLRLSNFKLEELTQILRGKSKWIKH